MRFIEEVQTSTYYAQDIPLAHIRTLVDLGALHHVHTTVLDSIVHRFYVPTEDVHPYTCSDMRTGATAVTSISAHDEHRINARPIR